MAEKILIIDDDIDTLKLVGLMLERQGYGIAVASNGSLGLTRAASEKPDLILLDVMMPDLDGYEVTRRMRADPALANIPIIMFTAKTMVDDKVAGFEAGVDDYLTKPTHPAELTAHVKAVLARSAQSRTPPSEKGRVIGFLGARGGLGTSTLAMNTGIVLHSSGRKVIVAEMTPGRASLALDLGLMNPTGLSNLLNRALKDINPRSVEAELVTHKSGVRLLLASSRPKEAELEETVVQMEAVVRNLITMAGVVILDLGAGLRPAIPALVELSDRVVLVTEPVYPSTVMARSLLEELITSGVPRNKLKLALVTRERTSLAVPWQQVQTDMGIDLAGIVSPAPEQAQQASQAGTPVVLLSPDSLVSDQLRKLALAVAAELQLVET